MTIDPLTAQDLYELVSQWPKEARQIGLDFNDYENGFPSHWTLDYGTREFCPLNYAIDLHIASGLRWLLRTSRVNIYPPSEDDSHFTLIINTERVYDAPTLFLALHAAILAAKENA